ncbi:hypothetical protein T02_12567 [Trichinella nativa]|uniref:Uncharacterized protein n=1 Tax=Trichinella nativa TaxID=6335 RepID=A0A0V1KTI7_9BILA|nr:hypothetical protein T02_12567 [Trichinella nativa]
MLSYASWKVMLLLIYLFSNKKKELLFQKCSSPWGCSTISNSTQKYFNCVYFKGCIFRIVEIFPVPGSHRHCIALSKIYKICKELYFFPDYWILFSKLPLDLKLNLFDYLTPVLNTNYWPVTNPFIYADASQKNF